MWKLYTDWAASKEGSGAGVVLIHSDKEEFAYVLRFKFQSSNNEAEYEGLLAGLQLAKQMKVRKLRIYVDSKLMANQVNDEFGTKDDWMKMYKDKAKQMMEEFDSSKIKQVPRRKNKKADVISKVATIAGATLKTLAKDISWKHSKKGPLIENLKWMW